jgi:phthiocerol/phenolphthiocerol synthesis type-I polyketide synthase A
VAWQGLGFAADAHVVLQELERVGSRPLIADEAFAAWEHVARYDVAQAVIAPMPSSEASASDAPDADLMSSAKAAWLQMPAEKAQSELENGLRTILARELQLPEAEFELDRPFAEMGLNSVMAMSVRRETEQFVGFELSVTMLWNHPTVESLDDLFDIVESAPAGGVES